MQISTGMQIIPLRPQLIALERQLVWHALQATSGDVRAAAQLLEMPWRTLYRRLQHPLELDPASFRHDASQSV